MRMRECPDCRERWFDIDVSKGACQHCYRARDKTPGKWTASNNMDPGPDLRALCIEAGIEPPPVPTQVEEMLLSLVHVQIQIWRVGGMQTKYAGHTCLFPRDHATFADRLPLRPADLDVLIVRPKDDALSARLASNIDFTVRARTVRDNLMALRQFHPSYRRVTVDFDALAQLPDDASVFDQLTAVHDSRGTEEAAAARAEPNDIDPDHVPAALVPNLPPLAPELDDMRGALAQLVPCDPPIAAPPSIAEEEPPPEPPPVLTAPRLRSTPINEFDQTSTHLIDAFPFLSPSGRADLNADRRFKVSEHHYFKHLMRYTDGRFAKHPRFRYYAFNSIMRHRSRRAAAYFVGRNADDSALSAADIRDLLEDDASRLAGRVFRMGATLRGSSAYWAQRARELQQMVRQLGSPCAFFTLSAADMQWPGLQRHMPNQPSSVEAERDRQRRTASNVNENPAVTAWYFQKRFDVFFATVIKPLFDVTDHWYRFEWQARGSSHVHGLIWSRTAPSAQTIDDALPESADRFVCFWQRHMSAINPGAHWPPASRHPASLTRADLSFSPKELAELLNRIQRHTVCSDTYCLRRPKGSNADTPKVCRFRYPKPVLRTASLSRIGRTYEFRAQRNDPLLNEYNPVMISAWRANMDIAAVSDRHAVTTYIAKYVSKCERPSENFVQVLSATSRAVSESAAGRVVFQKMLSKLLTERDWSAQEVSHFLLDCPAFGASRQFGSLCLAVRWSRRLRDPDSNDSTGEIEADDWRDRYYDRPRGAPFDSISLYQCVKEWRPARSRGDPPVRRTEERVIRLWPAYSPHDEQSDERQDWCRAKVLLHHPHRNPDTLDLRQDNEPWSVVYSRCVADCDHDHDDTLPSRQRTGVADSLSESEFSDGSAEELPREMEDFHYLAALGPRGQSDFDDRLSRLGRRDLDITHDWAEDTNSWTLSGLESRCAYLAEAIASSGTLDADRDQRIDPDALNDDQRRVYLKVTRHHHALVDGLAPLPFLLNIDGTAGTGKSFLIDAISQFLSDSPLASTRPILRRLAPTGVAAFNINGETYHSALALRPNPSTSGLFGEVAPSRLAALQESWGAVRYLIIDEKSMIGTLGLAQIDRRLAQIFPAAAHPFGGLSVLLFGDFAQLPPVGDTPMYSRNQGSAIGDLAQARFHGRRCFPAFAESITLGQIMRQAATDPQTVAFKNVLRHLRCGKVVPDDYAVLRTRSWDQVGLANRESFRDSILLASDQTVDKINHNTL